MLSLNLAWMKVLRLAFQSFVLVFSTLMYRHRISSIRASKADFLPQHLFQFGTWAVGQVHEACIPPTLLQEHTFLPAQSFFECVVICTPAVFTSLMICSAIPNMICSSACGYLIMYTNPTLPPDKEIRESYGGLGNCFVSFRLPSAERNNFPDRGLISQSDNCDGSPNPKRPLELETSPGTSYPYYLLNRDWDKGVPGRCKPWPLEKMRREKTMSDFVLNILQGRD